MKACQDKGGRMVDVMRFLLTYGLDLITGMVDNKPCLSKLVKASVRRLLKEMVEYSTKELDSNLLKATPLKRVASAQGCSSLPEKRPHKHANEARGLALSQVILLPVFTYLKY